MSKEQNGTRPEFDMAKLKGRIIEKYGTLQQFASIFGIFQGTLGKKLDGRSYWDQAEIIRAAELLDVTPEEIPVFFFTLKS